MNATEIYEKLKDPNVVMTFDETQEQELHELLEGLYNIDLWKDVKLGEIYVAEDVTGRSQTGVSLVHQGETYPIHEDAIFSVKRRALNNSAILAKMKPHHVATMLNMSWPYVAENDAKILVRAGNLIGLHSGEYCALPQKDVLQHLLVYMEMDYDAYTFVEAEYTHRMSRITYEIDDYELVKDYLGDLALCVGSPVDPGDVKFLVSLWMGDSAECSVQVYPQITVNGTTQVPFSMPMTVVHRNGVTMKDVDNAIQKMYSYIEDAINHIDRMLKIRLDHPEAAVYRLIKKNKLPMKLFVPLAGHFQMPGMSAHDVYFSMGRFMEDPRYLDLPVRRQIEYRNNMSKVLLMTEDEWTRVDKPGKGLEE